MGMFDFLKRKYQCENGHKIIQYKVIDGKKICSKCKADIVYKLT